MTTNDVHFQALQVIGEDKEAHSSNLASHVKVIQNRSSLITYETLSVEKDENDKVLEASKNLPDFLITAGAYELFGVSVFKAAFIEILGSIGQCWMRISIVYACQSYTYPPAQIGFVSGIIITLYIYQFAMSSGGHFNSLITVTSMCTGHIPIVRGLLYIPSQVLGEIWFKYCNKALIEKLRLFIIPFYSL
jgi:Major intrinsic protein